jgi:hypothetical protein
MDKDIELLNKYDLKSLKIIVDNLKIKVNKTNSNKNTLINKILDKYYINDNNELKLKYENYEDYVKKYNLYKSSQLAGNNNIILNNRINKLKKII